MSEAKRESPLACVLGAFTPAQRARWNELRQRWRSRVEDVRELADGWALRLPGDAETLLAAAEWMTLERLCCPFLGFALALEPEGGATWLRLTGRAEVKEFLRGALHGSG